ncbi:AbrB/MazE/SpoVT family DNA-binding domain-containing protein [Thermoproteota archaeon]
MADILVETTKLSEKGQIVIPKDFRKKMNLKPGIQFLVIATEDAIILQQMEVIKKKIDFEKTVNNAKEIIEKLGSNK